MSKINNNSKHYHNISNGRKSRIIILCDSTQWSNIILHSSDQFISCILHNANGVSLLCTTVYAFNDEAKRMDLWNYIFEKPNFFYHPWIVAGGFNSIPSSNDRTNNGLYNSMGDHDFIDCISASNPMEPDFTGNYFTWRGG